MALMTSMVLNCSQPEYMYFERKNYYYPDLPKGFQLTQETKPIPVGIYGHVEYECNGEEKSVRVNNLHLEEDAASSEHLFDTTTIDYNRAGVPLLELVTEPDFHSSDEAVAFLEHMRSVYQYLDISEADSKKGQLRCDVNVSIMDLDKDENDPNNWGTKVEIKNVNSFGGVRDAINYEIKRQSHLKDNGEYDKVVQETRRWDEESGTTISMRSKVDAVDYKYFVEPNIPKFKLSKEWLDEIRESNSIESNVVDLLDVELSQGMACVQELIKHAHQKGIGVIVSQHDFKKTPEASNLITTMEQMAGYGADVCKIAVMPQSLADVAALLLATGTMKENHPETLLITMSMGRTGCVSRLCGGLFGSVMSFGSMGKASAPGQVSAKELSDVLWAIERAVE